MAPKERITPRDANGHELIDLEVLQSGSALDVTIFSVPQTLIDRFGPGDAVHSTGGIIGQGKDGYIVQFIETPQPIACFIQQRCTDIVGSRGFAFKGPVSKRFEFRTTEQATSAKEGVETAFEYVNHWFCGFRV